MAVFVAEALLNEITDRKHAEGYRLPHEQQMLEQFGVARGTLREALRILEQNGVVEMRAGPGGGPVVAEPNGRHLASTLALVLQMRGATIRQVVHARAVLEPMVAALAAEHASDAELDMVGRSVDAMRDSLSDREGFVNSNMAFHDRIADASGNELFAAIVHALDWILEGKFELDYSAGARKAILRSHELIYEALLTRDPDAVHAAMEDHLGEIEAFMQRKNVAAMNRMVRWDEVRDIR